MLLRNCLLLMLTLLVFGCNPKAAPEPVLWTDWYQQSPGPKEITVKFTSYNDDDGILRCRASYDEEVWDEIQLALQDIIWENDLISLYAHFAYGDVKINVSMKADENGILHAGGGIPKHLFCEEAPLSVTFKFDIATEEWIEGERIKK